MAMTEGPSSIDFNGSATTTREFDALCREVLDSAIDTAVIAIDGQGRVMTWSAGAEHITGWTAAEMLGQPLATLFTPEDRTAGWPAMEMRAAEATGRASDMRWHLRKDGQRFFAHGSVTPLTGPVKGYVKSFRDATVQHQAETELKVFQERYRSLFTSIDSGFCVVDIEYGPDQEAVDYRFVEINPAFAANTGLENVVGKSIREIVPAIESYWIDIYAGVASSGQSIRFENRALALDHRWYAVYAFRIDDPALRRVAILFNDITEKKHAEAALRISEARLENALTIAALGTFEWNLRTQTIVLSERGRQIFGFAPHETPSAAEIIARIQPNDYSRVLAQATKGLTGGGRRTVEYRVLLPDGTVRHVKSVSDVAPDDEEPQRFVGVLEDITAARLAAQRLAQMNDTLERRVKTRTRALRRSENRFRAYFDASPEYLYLLRLNPEDQWVIEDANPAGAALYGLSREALIGQMLADLDHPDDVKRLDAQVRRVLNSGITGSFESRRLVNGSWIVINTTVAPVNPADGLNLVLVSSRDLTGQRQAEDALRQSQKMEAIGQLTGGIAHDFNNLLAGVMGSLELMQKRIMQGRVNDLDRYIASAREASTRAAGLTHRLLAFSRRQTLSPILTDVNRLVKSMEELIRRTIGPEVELDVAATENLWMTQVDPNQLENALLNLCINSRDAMPSGGRVTIETANFEVDDRMAREGNLLVGQYVSLSVTDTGVGMTPEVAMRAFDPFFTTKPLGSGTGLGLSMIYGFTKQSGGHVRIYSELGRGATVSLYLPRSVGEGESVSSSAAKLTQAPAAAGQIVLVVDDEATVRMLILEVLQDLGYGALEAGDGAAALEILRSASRIDLLVTDVGLPGMNGRQLADAARVLRPELKVLFITGYAENAVINHGHLEAGMQIMTKPFMMAALSNKVRDLLEDP
jgi:PAS domain S-box-containing protein